MERVTLKARCNAPSPIYERAAKWGAGIGLLWIVLLSGLRAQGIHPPIDESVAMGLVWVCLGAFLGGNMLIISVSWDEAVRAELMRYESEAIDTEWAKALNREAYYMEFVLADSSNVLKESLHAKILAFVRAERLLVDNGFRSGKGWE